MTCCGLRKKAAKTVRYKRSLGRKYTQFKGFYDKNGPDNLDPPDISQGVGTIAPSDELHKDVNTFLHMRSISSNSK